MWPWNRTIACSCSVQEQTLFLAQRLGRTQKSEHRGSAALRRACACPSLCGPCISAESCHISAFPRPTTLVAHGQVTIGDRLVLISAEVGEAVGTLKH